MKEFEYKCTEIKKEMKDTEKMLNLILEREVKK